MLEPGWEVKRELLVRDKKTQITVVEDDNLVKIFTPDDEALHLKKEYASSLYETLGLYLEEIEK